MLVSLGCVALYSVPFQRKAIRPLRQHFQPEGGAMRIRLIRQYNEHRFEKAAGGKWNPTRRVWELPYEKAVALNLEARIMPEERSISRAFSAQSKFMLDGSHQSPVRRGTSPVSLSSL